jgi:Txe/YoeB family toxin of Txe-Axe toxin-antitoxin module
MFKILPLNKKLLKKIAKYNLKKKFDKQTKILRKNPKHPSLHLELLEPKQYGIYSFRIDRKFRALCFFHPDKKTIEILNITLHYH